MLPSRAAPRTYKNDWGESMESVGWTPVVARAPQQEAAADHEQAAPRDEDRARHAALEGAHERVAGRRIDVEAGPAIERQERAAAGDRARAEHERADPQPKIGATAGGV